MKKNGTHSNNYWTKERIFQFVKEHNITSRYNLQKFKQNGITGSGAYVAACRLKILNELFGKRIFWTKEMCANLSNKCKTRSEFVEKYPKAANAARRHGWYEEITSHMPKWKNEEKYDRFKYLIYAYEELFTHSVYIGLTNNINRRDKEHRYPNKNGYDTLATYCIKHNVEIPTPKILKENLTATAARIQETKYWHLYKDNGWNMINSKNSLGYLGGNFNRKWTEETVRKYIYDNPNIKNRADLNEKNSAAYRIASELKILDDLFGKNTQIIYTKEDIVKFVNEHPEIKIREDLRSIKPGMYKAAWKFKMFNELFGDIQNKIHTEEEIKQFLNKHPEITRRIDFCRQNRNLYEAAVRLKILEDLFGERQRFTKWNKNTIKEFLKNNPDIKTRTDFYHKAKRAYDKAKQLNILDELFPIK